MGVHDNFFDLGGHSLAAMRALGLLRAQFDAELTIASFFEHPTIEAYAVYLTEQLIKAGPLGLPEANGVTAGAG